MREKSGVRKKIVIALLFLFIFIPLIMWFSWVFKTARVFHVLILDKTVLNKKVQEHRSLNWILTHEKFVRPSERLYEPSQDYYGFFPLKDKKYRINGLENFNSKEIGDLSRIYNAAYYTDTYGIYYNEWYLKRNETERSNLIYGGMNTSDFLFLKKMKEQNKLVLLEFNSIATPTPSKIRKNVEDLFDVHWSGWTGRYFDILDTLRNPELPRWVIRLYKVQHQNKWPFRKSGIVFVHTSDRIEILEEETHLNSKLPKLTSGKETVEKFGVTPEITYFYWFDIMNISGKNRVLSWFRIDSNSRGDSLLSALKIPKMFPAVIMNSETRKFYYFAGDFADNPIGLTSAYLRGIEYFRFLINFGNKLDRTKFFWDFYRPLVTTILNDDYNKKN